MRPTRSELTALGCALAPFVVYFGSSGSYTVNGQVISRYDYNYAGILLGAMAIAMALRALTRLRSEAPHDPRTVHFAIVACIVGLAAYQVVRGAGYLA